MTFEKAGAWATAQFKQPGISELLPIHQATDGRYFFSGSLNVDAVLIGSRWTTSELTYSFPTSGVFYGENYYENRNQYLDPFNAQQQDAARYAFDLISSYTNLTFTKIPETATNHAILRLSQTGSPSLLSAEGWFPSGLGQSGDIWFGETGEPFYTTPAKGNWGQATIMHEIGHALGLKHGHEDYTWEDLSSELGTASPRPGTPALPMQHDGQAWSLMTYRSDPYDWENHYEADGSNQPQTYMQNDIAALQYLYGANYDTNSTDSVYTWSPQTGEMFINGVGQGRPAGNKIFLTIWDGGGVDTYDVSNYAHNVSLDLRPGQFSAFSTEQLADNRPLKGGPVFAPGNVANALLYEGDTRSLIENAISGDGNDVLMGNWADNTLSSGGGRDILNGGSGIDLLNGGDGVDVAWFNISVGAVTDVEETDAFVVVNSAVGQTSLTGIELVRFADKVVLSDEPEDVVVLSDGRAFDDAFYLSQNKDVAQAVDAGILASALDHYLLYGEHEGRDANVLFDEAWYRSFYEDVGLAIEQGDYANGYEHYVLYGWKEKRLPSLWMNTSNYLETNEDVASANIDPLTHYLEYGVHEERAIVAAPWSPWAI